MPVDACFNCCCDAQVPGERCCPAPCPEQDTVCCLPELCCGRNGPEAVCCEEDEVCCGPEGQRFCCPVGEKCCDEEYCCPEDDTCCGGECCPEGRVCCEEVCCPEGECCVGGECGPCCEEDEDCPEGQCCVDGECVPCPCESDEDCPEGECCVGGQCVTCPDCDGCAGASPFVSLAPTLVIGDESYPLYGSGHQSGVRGCVNATNGGSWSQPGGADTPLLFGRPIEQCTIGDLTECNSFESITGVCDEDGLAFTFTRETQCFDQREDAPNRGAVVCTRTQVWDFLFTQYDENGCPYGEASIVSSSDETVCAEQPAGDCSYIWTGDSWFFEGGTCEGSCSPPEGSGSFMGETASGACDEEPAEGPPDFCNFSCELTGTPFILIPDDPP